MAKVALNSALSSIRGAIDNWVYRKPSYGLILARRPTSQPPPTPEQLAFRAQFAAAAAYAKRVLGDPALRPLYLAAAAAKGQRPAAFAVADFLKPPVVRTIDTTAYHGAIGNVIKVEAVDTFEVMEVTVTIRNAATSAIIEQGSTGLNNGLWLYTATTAIPAGTSVKIEAVATDRPGHTGSHTVTILVG